MPVLALFLAATIVLTDQLLKLLVTVALKPIGSVTAIPHLLDLTYVENQGAAFGMMQNQRWFFIVMTSIVMIFFIYLMVSGRIHSKMLWAASILILGGGIGNLIDRIFLGYVIDYLQLSFFPPVCNFADYSITAGVVLLIVYIFFFSSAHEKKQDHSLDVEATK